MSALTYRPATAADAPAIAVLANQHTHQQLSAAARQGGFLTGQFAAPALAAMLASVPGQVVYEGAELVGFVVNSRLPAERYPPLVRQISALLPTLLYKGRPLADYQWFFYGPVLVQPAYRGQGVLRQLFEANRRALAGRYEVGVAFVAAENVASLHVHTQKLGLEVVGSLDFEGAGYVVLAFAVS
jgi:GNAT superfamily N-acetyltransferase